MSQAGTFAALLRRYREAAELTQEELAERAGISSKAIGALERGARRRPYPQTIRQLADALHLSGRTDEARALFERLLGLRSDLGLLAEEYDPRAKRLLGNFPQAFSHVALVNAAFSLAHGYSATADIHATPEALDPQGVRA